MYLSSEASFYLLHARKKKLTVCVDVCVCGCTANLLVLVLGRQKEKRYCSPSMMTKMDLCRHGKLIAY